jgi:O-antigen/teichoic acid export membrane protein
VSRVDVFAGVATTDGLRRNLRARSIRGAIYLALGSGGEFALRIVSTSILARLLVPEHFGLITMVTAITGIAGQFSQLGLSTVTIQRRDIDHHQVSNLFWINVALGVTLFGIFCAVSPLVARFYQDQRLVPITIALSSAFLWGGLTVQHEALLARQMKQPQATFVRLATGLVSAALAVALALRGFGYWALVWQEVARTFLTAIGMWAVCPWRPALPNRSGNIRGLLRFGTDLTLTQLSYAVISNIDRLLVGKFFGAVSLGIFRQAQQLIMAPLEQLNGPIGSISQPGLSVLQDDPERYRRYYAKTVFMIGLLTMPIAAFAAVYADDLVLLILGRQWIEAVPFFRIFAVAAFIRPVLGTAGTVLITCGQSRRLLVMTVATQITLLLFILAGIRWGPMGVAMAQALTPAVLLLPNLYYGFAASPVTPAVFFRAIRAPVVASAVMVTGLVALRTATSGLQALGSLGIGFVVGGALYWGSCLLQSSCRREIEVLVGDVVESLRRKAVTAVE